MSKRLRALSEMSRYQCTVNLTVFTPVFTASHSSLETQENARYLQTVAYLYASEAFNFSLLYTGSSSANKEEVGKQGLLFVGELL